MSLLLLPPPPAPSFDACLDLLDEGVGSQPPQNAIDFGPFRMIPLGFRKGWPVAVCEAAVAGGFPPYLERLAWRDRGGEPFRSGILIHTDAAHSSFVWSWRVPSSLGGVEYREHRTPGRETTLQLGLRSLPCFGVSPEATPPDPLVLERLRDFIAPAMVRESSADTVTALREWIERISSPQEVRGRWRSMRRFGVLDQDCRTGERLVQGSWALEVVYLALLERMRSFLDDAAGSRERKRPEHLRDLRQIVGGAERASLDFERVRFVRRLIVQQNLFAIASESAAARRCSRDLLLYAGIGEEGVPVLDCNIWHRRADGHRMRASAEGARPEQTRAGLIREEELFQRAWREVRRMRLEGGDPAEFARAGQQMEARRRMLRRQLLELGASDSGSTKGEEPFSFCGDPAGEGRIRAVLGSRRR